MSRATPTILAVFLFCAACQDSPRATLMKACQSAAAHRASIAESVAIAQQCFCAADGAAKYLDKADYTRLVGVAEIYNSPDPDDLKLHRLADAMVKSGLTFRQAMVSAMDLMFLAHKVANECPVTAR